MGIISWIILGALAGWLASLFMKTDAQMGAIANIAVGIIGSVIGGYVMNFFNRAGVEKFSLYSLGVAFLGAIIFLAIFKAIRRKWYEKKKRS